MNIERLQGPAFTKPSGNEVARINRTTGIWGKITWGKMTKVAVCSSLVVLANHRSIAAAATSAHLNHRNMFSSPDLAQTSPFTTIASKVEVENFCQKDNLANQCQDKNAKTCSFDDFDAENKGLSGVGELAFSTIRGAHVYAQSELNCRYGLDKPATIGQMFALPLAEAMRDAPLQEAVKNMTNEVLSSVLPQALDSFLNVTNETEFRQKVEDLSEVIARGLLKGVVGGLGNVTADLLKNPQLQNSIKSLVNTMFEEGFKKLPQIMSVLALMTSAVIFAAAMGLVCAVHLYQKIMGGKNSIMTHVAKDALEGAIGGANAAAHLNYLAQNASAGAIVGILDELKKPENIQVLFDFGEKMAAAGTRLNTGGRNTPLNTDDQSQSHSGNEYDHLSEIV